MSQFLNEGKNRERKVASIPGVFLIKLSEYWFRSPYIAMKINPVNTSGIATEKGGILIRYSSDLKQSNNILIDTKIIQQEDSTDKINPKRKTILMSNKADAFEI